MTKLIRILFVIFLYLIVLGQFGRIPFFESGMSAVYLSDIALIILVLVYCLDVIINKKQIRLSFIGMLILLFVCATLVSLIASVRWVTQYQLSVGFLYWIRIVVYLMLVPITLTAFKHRKKLLASHLLIAGSLFAIIGLLQILIFPDFSSFVAHGWDPHYYRVLSTFYDPNYAGIFLTLLSLFCINLIQNKPRRSNSILLVLLALMISGVILTFSRSSYLALISGLTLYSIFKDPRIILAMAIIGFTAFAFIPKVQTRVIGAITLDETAILRIENYAKTIEIIKENPIVGVGFNTFRYAQIDSGYFRDERGVMQSSGLAGAGADNSLLFIWATGGIISLISILLIIAAVLIKTTKSKNFPLVLGLIGAIMVHCQFVNSLFYTWVLAILLIVVSLSIDGDM